MPNSHRQPSPFQHAARRCPHRPLQMGYHQAHQVCGRRQNPAQKFREGGRAFQYMLEGLRGFQIPYVKLIPAGSGNKVPKETEDIRKGFEFIRTNCKGQFTYWTEEQVNDPNGPLHKWDKGTIKEYLRCLADQGSQANTITDWPLTLKSLTPWALNVVIDLALRPLQRHRLDWEVASWQEPGFVHAVLCGFWRTSRMSPASRHATTWTISGRRRGGALSPGSLMMATSTWNTPHP